MTRGKLRLIVRNIVAVVQLGTRVDLQRVAANLPTARYDPEQFAGAVVTLPESQVTALVFSSGKAVLVGMRHFGAVADTIRELDEVVSRVDANVLVREWRIVNIVVTGDLGIRVDAARFLRVADRGHFYYDSESPRSIIYTVPTTHKSILISRGGKLTVVGFDSLHMIQEAASAFLEEFWEALRSSSEENGPSRPPTVSVVEDKDE